MSKASGLLKASKLALTHGYWQIRCDQKALTPVPWNFLKQILGSKEKQASRKMNMQQDKDKGRFMPKTKGDSCPKWREIHKRNEGRFIHEMRDNSYTKRREIHARRENSYMKRRESESRGREWVLISLFWLYRRSFYISIIHGVISLPSDPTSGISEFTRTRFPSQETLVNSAYSDLI